MFILKWRSASFWELYHTVGPILKTGVLRLCQSLVRLCCYCLQLYVCLSVSLMCDCLPYGVWSRSSSSLSVDDEPMHLLFRCRPVNGVSLRLLTYRSQVLICEIATAFLIWLCQGEGGDPVLSQIVIWLNNWKSFFFFFFIIQTMETLTFKAHPPKAVTFSQWLD